MFKVSMRVEGLKQIIDGLANVERQDLHDTKAEILRQGSELFVKEAESRVHVITGKTRDSIAADPVSNDANSVDIHAEFGAFWEERRKDPHDFMTQAKIITEGEMPIIITREMEKMWNKNRASVSVGSKFF